MANPYKGEIPINAAIVCITEYKENKETKYGLSIRYYADNEHVFANGYSDNNLAICKSIPFTDFVAVIKLSDFNADSFVRNPDFYLTNYKTK